ncbi:MAG: DUF2271 domain-containing protein [Planctomycetes bacterium]|nr:DUF2271 domain-containing protein [Planctomycetota bacterium]
MTDLPRPSPAFSPSFAALLAALLLAPAAVAQATPAFPSAREGVLGSSGRLIVLAPDAATAARAEAAVFHEVERLDRVLSTWRDDSELAGLIRTGGGKPSTELRTVLALAERWRRDSGGAFEPGVARLTALWTAAAERGTPPAEAELQAAVSALRQPSFELHDEALRIHGPISLDALAKGWIVDRAAAAVAGIEGAALQSFQIGGDTRLGQTPSAIAIADPRQPADNRAPLCTLQLAGCAVATSGGHARGFEVAGRHRSHLLDPRTGQPCDAVLGASVVADDTTTADALATILCVLGPTEGLALLAKVPGASGVLVTADGAVHASEAFLRLPGAEELARTAPAITSDGSDGDDRSWPTDFALQVEFEIKAPATTGGRGRGGWKRPYVAVWIEDLTGAPARTLCLWLEDRRWLRDLRRWSKQHAELPELVGTVSQATRKAGSYTLAWDGKDDEGRQLAAGRYTVCIEVVREHGGYQLIRRDLDLVRAPQTLDVAGGDEIAKARLVFGPPARSQVR